MKLKRCYICKKDLPLESFSKDKARYDGLSSGCKICRNKLKKIYRENNKDIIQKYRDSHKEEMVALHRRWEILHPEERRITWQKRRNRKKQLPSTLTIEQWEKVKQAFDNKCAYCGKMLPLEKEHFIALTNSGEFTSNNIICACKSCNSGKANRDFFEWYPRQKFHSKKRENKILKFLNYKTDGTQQLQQLGIL